MSSQRDHPVYSIGAVARMLDIPASTLRAWEDRYSLITPARSDGSQRLYSRVQLEQLRFIKTQIESGVSASDAHRLLAEQMPSGLTPPPPSDTSEDQRPLVLIAERDPYAAGLAEYFLRTEGYGVEIALDGAEAKRKFSDRSPDVVVVDLLISGGAGFRLVSEFAQDNHAQILAVAPIDAADEAIRAGAAAFIHKPIESLKLVAAVRDLLGTSAVVRSSRKQSATP